MIKPYTYLCWAGMVALMVVSTAVSVGSDEIPHPRNMEFDSLPWGIPRMEDNFYTLNPHMSLFYIHDESLPVFSLRIIFRNGKYESPLLAAYYEDLVLRGGSASYQPREIDSLFDLYALETSVTTTETSTEITVRGLSRFYTEACDLLHSLFSDPSFDTARISKIKSELSEEIRNRFTTPPPILEAAWKRVVYPDSPLSHLLSAEQIADSAVEDIQKKLFDYHFRMRDSTELIFALAGDIPKDDFVSFAEETFPFEASRKENGIITDTGLYSPRILVVHREANQAFVRFGHPIFKRPNTYFYPLTIFNDILGGGGFSSRLVQNVRSDRGLTYSIRSVINADYFYPGYFGVTFSTGTSRINEALFVSMEIVDTSLEQTESIEKTEEVRRKFVTSLPSFFRTAEDMVFTYADNHLKNRPLDHFIRYEQELQEITPDDMYEAKNAVISPEEYSIVIVGDTTQLFSAAPYEGKSLEDLNPEVILPRQLY
ncbi:MAG: M16 family metallopeptidase [Fibrobacterota bacterium]